MCGIVADNFRYYFNKKYASLPPTRISTLPPPKSLALQMHFLVEKKCCKIHPPLSPIPSLVSLPTSIFRLGSKFSEGVYAARPGYVATICVCKSVCVFVCLCAFPLHPPPSFLASYFSSARTL